MKASLLLFLTSSVSAVTATNPPDDRASPRSASVADPGDLQRKRAVASITAPLHRAVHVTSRAAPRGAFLARLAPSFGRSSNRRTHQDAPGARPDAPKCDHSAGSYQTDVDIPLGGAPASGVTAPRIYLAQAESGVASDAMPDRGSAPDQPAPPEARSKSAPATVGTAPESRAKPPEVAPIFQQPGVLTAAGHWVVEPSMQYDYSSNSRVSIVGFDVSNFLNIGFFNVSRVNSTSWTAAVTGRYGVTRRFELEGRVPFVSRNDDTAERPISGSSSIDQLFSTKGSGLGDVEVTGRYQLNEGGNDHPYYVGTLRLKSRTGRDQFSSDVIPVTGGSPILTRLPTGTGFFGIQPGITMLYASDPAVFFGSLTYMYNVRRNISDPALLGVARPVHVDPGNIFGFNFGMGLGLNDRASFSLGYDHSVIGRPRIDGSTPPEAITTQVGSLLLGFSYRLDQKTSLNLSLGIGVTKDAPSVQLRLRVPTLY